MTMIEKYFGSRINSALLIIRIIIGLIFFLHGIAKFNMGIDGTTAFFASVGIPLAALFAWIVTLVETFGGLALILGIGTRITALLLAITMIVASIIVIQMGSPLINTQLATGYELNLALIAALIPIIILGPGRYSLARYVIIKDQD
ncbi:MAG: DoxX family protein [Patescibacteria group bacterium]